MAGKKTAGKRKESTEKKEQTKKKKENFLWKGIKYAGIGIWWIIKYPPRSSNSYPSF